MGRKANTPRTFLTKVFITDACWLWQGNMQREGYGLFWFHDHYILAHRFSYESLVGPIPPGQHLDHLCRTRACVRPSHLEPVTCRVNLLRVVGLAALNVQKTHCIKGHAFTPENTGFERAGRKRVCRACKRLEIANRRQARRLLIQFSPI